MCKKILWETWNFHLVLKRKKSFPVEDIKRARVQQSFKTLLQSDQILYKLHQKSSGICTKKSGHSALLERRKKENHAVIKICGYIFFLSLSSIFLVKNYAACYKERKNLQSISLKIFSNHNFHWIFLIELTIEFYKKKILPPRNAKDKTF